MTTGHVFIAASLDGFIARPDGGLDWLLKQPTEAEDHGYDAFIASVDGLIMGSGSYRSVLQFDEWPYDKPVVVLSQNLGPEAIPMALRDRVSLSQGRPSDVMAELSGLGWNRAYVDGGRVVQAFLRAGLIEDMWITHIPILLGQGRPLFGTLDRDIDLEHIETRSYPSGLVGTRYRVREG